MNELKVILHPTDFSSNAQHALKLACDFARGCTARLILLHVAPPLPSQWVGSGLSLLHSHKSWWEMEAKLRWVDCGNLRPERILRSGSPAAAIVEVANQVNADLIVLGQPQASRWRWLVEERVANTVVRTASCPVLIAISRQARSTEVPPWREKSSQGSSNVADRQLELSINDREWGN